jgi:hypothetical protein
MATIRDLLRPITTVGLHLVAGEVTDADVRAVLIAETLDAIANAPAHSLVVLTPTCTRQSASYEFDIAVRQAAAIGTAGLVFVEPPTLSPTTTRLATRSRLALLGCTPGTAVADLVITLDQLTRGDSGTLMNRALAALHEVENIRLDEQLDDILARASSRLGTSIAVTDSGQAVFVNGHLRYHLSVDAEDDATRLALPSLAAAVGRWQESLDAERDAPEQARTEALSELLIREGTPIPSATTDRLRATGFSLDATHLAVCVSVGTPSVASEDELLARRLQRERVRLIASSALPPAQGWSIAIVEEDVILVLTHSRSRDASIRGVTTQLETLMGFLKADSDATNLFFGLGTAQVGLAGLQQSAKESRVAASAAANEGSAWTVTTFDSTGVNRLLAEMSSSWAGRRVIAELLAPLDALGSTRSQTSVETLVAYLDARGSLIEAGRALHLHPNAVAYRIRRIRELTGWNLEDAERRFALHVAGRIRLMQQTPSRLPNT